MGGIFSVYWRFLGILVGAHVCLEVFGYTGNGLDRDHGFGVFSCEGWEVIVVLSLRTILSIMKQYSLSLHFFFFSVRHSHIQY